MDEKQLAAHQKRQSKACEALSALTCLAELEPDERCETDRETAEYSLAKIMRYGTHDDFACAITKFVTYLHESHELDDCV